MHTAIIKTLEERQRQIHEEGFTAEHDDKYVHGDLAAAAASYAAICEDIARFGKSALDWQSPAFWPWPEHWWKPSDDPQRNIIKAMALLSAEYDRIERAKEEAKGADIEEAFSTNGEDWHIDDLAQFIADNELTECSEIERGEVIRYTGEEMCHWIDNSIIEIIQDQAYNEADEHASAYIDKLSKLAAEPKALLKTLVSAWADSYAQPDFYQVAGAKPYTLTRDDIAKARQESQA